MNYNNNSSNNHPFRNLDLQGYTLVYQPIFDRARRLVKFEVLLRPKSSLQMPVYQLIAFAERTGTIGIVDAWVRDKALSFLVKVHTIDPTVVMSVNLSPRSITPELPAQLEAQLKGAGIAPESLTLEITESQPLEDIPAKRKRIKAIQELGSTFVLDDFCTRWSILNHLPHLPVNGLKIDCSYTWMIDKPGYGKYLIERIVQIARDFNLEVVVEGVETQAQLKKVQELGVEYIQGFLLAKPMPAKQFLQFLTDHQQQRTAA